MHQGKKTLTKEQFHDIYIYFCIILSGLQAPAGRPTSALDVARARMATSKEEPLPPPADAPPFADDNNAEDVEKVCQAEARCVCILGFVSRDHKYIYI